MEEHVIRNYPEVHSWFESEVEEVQQTERIEQSDLKKFLTSNS